MNSTRVEVHFALRDSYCPEPVRIAMRDKIKAQLVSLRATITFKQEYRDYIEECLCIEQIYQRLAYVYVSLHEGGWPEDPDADKND